MVFNLIPSRFKIGFLGMTACSLLYTLRVNLNVAIVAMVNQTTNVAHPQDWCIEEYVSSPESSENKVKSNQLMIS